jgi:hypothetical protein
MEDGNVIIVGNANKDVEGSDSSFSCSRIANIRPVKKLNPA